jgi:hypothetical protein
MSRTNNNSSSRSPTDSHAYYKMTRTVTDADGKKHTETVEMVDNNALKVSQFIDNKSSYSYRYLLIAHARFTFTTW